jgi:hypothetical protein
MYRRNQERNGTGKIGIWRRNVARSQFHTSKRGILELNTEV